MTPEGKRDGAGVAPRRRKGPSRAARRGRSALLWTLAAFALAQAGLTAALCGSWRLRDPEYALRLAALRARVAECGTGRPLVLLLGSSRVGVNVMPGLLPGNRPNPGSGPVVFNFGLCSAGPVQELMCLRRLLADGVRPEALVAELAPESLGGTSVDCQPAFPSERLGWGDVRALAPLYGTPGELYTRWAGQHLVPWYEQRLGLLARWAPASWLSPADQRKRAEWEGLDPWGWLELAHFGGDGPQLRAARRANTVVECRRFAVPVDRFRATPVTRAALEELVGLCRREGIRVAFLLAPDLCRHEYAPGAACRLDAHLRALGHDLGVPLIDARGWAAPDDFHEGIHLTHAGAAAFTRRLERELGPCLAGEPFERRWPPGYLEPPPRLYWGPGFHPEELVADERWRWCRGGEGELALVNPSSQTRLCRLRFRARKCPGGPPARLTVEGLDAREELTVDLGGVAVEQVVDVPPGQRVLRLRCDARPYREPGPPEGRELVFALSEFSLDEADTQSPRRAPAETVAGGSVPAGPAALPTVVEAKTWHRAAKPALPDPH